MTEEKIIDASKKADKSQDKFTNERLTDDELEKVAGGVGFDTFAEQPLPPVDYAVGGK